MKVAVVGVGYVGLVAAACLADGGNSVICIDKDKKKINDLNNGIIPIYEPGLTDIVKHNEKAGRLKFTTDLKEGVDSSLIIVIAVGTPSGDDGSADISTVLAVSPNCHSCHSPGRWPSRKVPFDSSYCIQEGEYPIKR